MLCKKTRRLKRCAVLLATLITSSVCAESCKVFAESLYPKEFSIEDAVVHLKSEYSENGFVNSYMSDSVGNIIRNDLMSNLAKGSASSELPQKFNLNDMGYITSVKDQGDTGTCWAHSAINSAESNIIINNKADNTIDLSEAHMVYFGQYACSMDKSDPLCYEGMNIGEKAYSYGGNSFFTQGILAKGTGLVSQGSDEDITEYPVFDESRRYESEWLLSNSNEYSKNDREAIKNHIMTKGALSVSYYDDINFHSEENYSYYKSEPFLSETGASMINHAVSIVGWDDTFSKDKFKITPEGDGAWICKNSWGVNLDEKGYFYLSYYDATINDIYSVEVVESEKYDTIYQYDGSKANGLMFDNCVFTGANIFEAEKNSMLDAVSFYTTESDVPYIIYVSKNDADGKPMSGKIVHTQSGNMSYAGYHIVELSEEILLNKGETFTVSVCLNKPGTMLIGDMFINETGRSFVCVNNDLEWIDMSKLSSGFDIAVKAFTIDNYYINIDDKIFPDEIFRNYISKYFDTNEDLILSEEEISQVTSIDVSNMGIQQLTGIEYFENLETLKCSGNNLYFLNLENNKKLTILECENNSFTVYDAWCDQLQMNYLDMSRISDVEGASLGEISGTNYFIPNIGSTDISYKYKCSNELTATFTLKINNYIHYTINDNNKCSFCQADICAILSLDNKNVQCFYDDLQAVFDSAAYHETIYVYLCNNVEGNFNISSGLVYLIGNAYEILSSNVEPALKVNSGGSLVVNNCIINNTSTGKALYICKDAHTVLSQSVLSGVYTENESLADVIMDGYAFFDSDYAYVDPDTQSIDKPVVVYPAYKITYCLDGGENAEENPLFYTTYGVDIVLAEPTREGYTFVGWTYEGQTEPKKNVVIPSRSAEDKIFTANWEKTSGCTEHIDDDSDGYCDICCRISNEAGAVLVGYTLSLNGNIGINFYMDLDQRTVNDEDAYMLFTLPNGDKKQVYISEAVKNTSLNPNKIYYVFSCDVSSYEMTQQVKAQMFDGNGNSTHEYSYTVRDYAEYILRNPKYYYEEDVMFAKAILNYGACAQEYWNTEKEDLANKNLNESDRVINTLTASDLESYEVSKVTNKSGSFEGYSLVLKSETTLKAYYKPAEGTDINNLTFKANGQTVTPVKSGEYYILSVENIKAWDLDTNYKFEVYDGDETLEFSFSAMSYCYSVLKNSESYTDSLIQLISALRIYQQRSEVYQP